MALWHKRYAHSDNQPKRTLRDLHSLTLANGGGTFDRSTREDVTSGYAVAIVDGTFAKVQRDNYFAFADAIRTLVHKFADANIGTWLDDDGIIHVDPSIVVATEEEAREYAIAHNQLAYYIIHEQREVRL